LGGHRHLNKPTDRASSNPAPSFATGQEQAEAMLGMQKELLDAYEQASRAWLARVKSEVDLWTELTANLTATRFLPEALGTYQECVHNANGGGGRTADVRGVSKTSAKIHPPAAPMSGRPVAAPGQGAILEMPAAALHSRNGDRHGTGLDDEARRLELAVSTLPPEERGSVSVGPFSTD
jgi:hypothetical protein